VCKRFPILDKHGYPTGETELLVDRAFMEDTGKPVIVPHVHPTELGAVFDPAFGEWVIHEIK
jgi:hypothetical protein